MPAKKLQKSVAGRPTKYNENALVVYEEYMSEAIPQNMKIPTVEGLALKLGVNKTTVYEWAKKNKIFSNALTNLKMKQKEMLTEIGIFGGKEINSNIVQLLLKVNHNMQETPQVLQQFNSDSVEIVDYSNAKTTS